MKRIKIPKIIYEIIPLVYIISGVCLLEYIIVSGLAMIISGMLCLRYRYSYRSRMEYRYRKYLS